MPNTTVTKTPKSGGIRIKSRVKAGGAPGNHNQAAKGLRIKSRVRAGGGGVTHNHNQAVARRVA